MTLASPSSSVTATDDLRQLLRVYSSGTSPSTAAERRMGCAIKGNIDDRSEQIYLVPGPGARREMFLLRMGKFVGWVSKALNYKPQAAFWPAIRLSANRKLVLVVQSSRQSEEAARTSFLQSEHWVAVSASPVIAPTVRPNIQMEPRACLRFPSSETSRRPVVWSALTISSASFCSITRTVRCGCFDRNASVRSTSNQLPCWSSTTLPTPWASDARKPSWGRKAKSAAVDDFPSEAKAPAGPIKVTNSSNRCPTK